MKFLLLSLTVVLVALSLIESTHGIVCLEQTCATVRCAAVTEENCLGNIIENGGYCGCCDACQQVIKEGDICLNMILLGAPNSAACDQGLHCNPNTLRCEAN